jgi:hypothetical protein
LSRPLLFFVDVRWSAILLVVYTVLFVAWVTVYQVLRNDQLSTLSILKVESSVN